MKIKLLLLTLILGVTAALPITAFSQQAPLYFDAFLADNGGMPAENFNLFFLWDVTDGSVDLVGGNVPGAVDQVNGRFVDLGGSTGRPGIFTSRTLFPFAAEMTYNLTFDYKSTDGNANSAQVTIGSQIFTVSSDTTDLRTFSQNFSFSTLTTAPVAFRNDVNDTDNSGIGIDNVLLTQVIAPTAATVSVGGRATTASGEAIANVLISMTDSSGEVRGAKTDSSGYYKFSDVEVGSTYIITATGKRFTFSQPSQVINVSDDATEINFIGTSEKRLRAF